MYKNILYIFKCSFPYLTFTNAGTTNQLYDVAGTFPGRVQIVYYTKTPYEFKKKD